TEIDRSYSWQRGDRLVCDVADLYLPEVGHLECRPVQVGDSICQVPPEVWDDRIGYVVVCLEEETHQGRLLGFTTQVQRTSLPLSQLDPLEELLVHYQATCPTSEQAAEQATEKTYEPATPLRHLSQWFTQQTIAGWQSWNQPLDQQLKQRSLPLLIHLSNHLQPLDRQIRQTLQQTLTEVCRSLSADPVSSAPLNPYQPQLAYRGPQTVARSAPLRQQLPPQSTDSLVDILRNTQDETMRWIAAEMLWTLTPEHPEIAGRRVLDLGMLMTGQAIALMVAILRKPNQTFSVLLRLYPMGEQSHLPIGLQLMAQHPDGVVFSSAQARQKDNYIQLYFVAEAGDRFQVHVRLGEAIVTEYFTV
ncbi:MAG: DUF1822 family protein, partial [Synechococcales bacterium]|nr:DUF1822 family protein [Synechococcales bacterium]